MRIIASVLLLGLCAAQSPVFAQDQAAADTVTWSITAPAEAAPGSKQTVALQGTVQEGWHVYALKQLPDGPTPLRVALETNPVAAAAGAPTASKPITIHDPSFDLKTRYYTQPFTVSLPVRVDAHAKAGAQAIPVSVTFQTCNGRICQPPKTVHLSATLTVAAN
jgi:DsbC/DsbD-like thiol-disulfide interchange protein